MYVYVVCTVLASTTSPLKAKVLQKCFIKTAHYITVHVKPGTETLEEKRHETKMETMPIILILTAHGHR